MYNKKAKLIIFEGFDGSGKTTLMKEVEERIKNYINIPKIRKDIKIHTTHSPIDKALNYKYDNWDWGLAIGYAIDSKKHQEKILEPMLRIYDIVLLDRYIYSNYAYRKSLKFNILNKIYQKNNVLKPDLVVFLERTDADIISVNKTEINKRYKSYFSKHIPEKKFIHIVWNKEETIKEKNKKIDRIIDKICQIL